MQNKSGYKPKNESCIQKILTTIGNPIDFERHRFHIDFSQTTEYLHLLLTVTHSTELVQHNHMVDY